MTGISISRVDFTREITHFEEGGDYIVSRFNRITYKVDAHHFSFALPLPLMKRILGSFRKVRRALRLDKMNVALSQDRNYLVIIWQGVVYSHKVSDVNFDATPRLHLKNCRNVLHGGVLSYDSMSFVFGEYGSNPSRVEVPIYVSVDGGYSWRIAHSFKPGQIRHVHGCFYDKLTDRYWVATGDSDGECYLFVFDRNFKLLEQLGDGTQLWRTCYLFFTEDYIYWGMDSEKQTSHLIRFDRKDKTIKVGVDFPGPVWYGKSLNEGVHLLATTAEVGEGVKTDSAYIYASTDLCNWQEVFSVKHDRWPKRWFKFGVFAFAEGRQSVKGFAFHCEALKKIDGASVVAKLEEVS